MHAYAQTSVQLWNQLQRAEYSTPDLAAIGGAYQLAQQLFAGHFRPSGKPMHDHLIGTASILATLGAPLSLVIAGLLHAAYAGGDFGAIKNGNFKAKREHLQSVLEQETEALLAAYHAFPWNTDAILDAERNFSSLRQTERDVILIRLANDLEDCLDLAILLCPNRQTRVESLQRLSPSLIKMANALHPLIAEELKCAHEAIFAVEDWASFPIASAYNNEWMQAPPSYRKRAAAAMIEPLSRNKCHAVGKIRRLARAK